MRYMEELKESMEIMQRKNEEYRRQVGVRMAAGRTQGVDKELSPCGGERREERECRAVPARRQLQVGAMRG